MTLLDFLLLMRFCVAAQGGTNHHRGSYPFIGSQNTKKQKKQKQSSDAQICFSCSSNLYCEILYNLSSNLNETMQEMSLQLNCHRVIELKKISI